MIEPPASLTVPLPLTSRLVSAVPAPTAPLISVIPLSVRVNAFAPFTAPSSFRPTPLSSTSAVSVIAFVKVCDDDVSIWLAPMDDVPDTLNVVTPVTVSVPSPLPSTALPVIVRALLPPVTASRKLTVVPVTTMSFLSVTASL